MSEIEITDIIPQPADFFLEATGETKHQLRAVTLQDRAWATQVYGGEKGVEKAFAGANVDAIAPFIYRLLVDKSPFPAREAKHWFGDDGVFYFTDAKDPKIKKIKKENPDALCEQSDKPKRIPGWETMLEHCTGIADHIMLRSALLKTIGLSNPKLDAEADEYKKKVIELIRIGMKEAEDAGEKSFISSPTDTDGHMSTSQPSPSDKSQSQATA